MQFHEITAADGEWARPRLEGAGFRSCEFAFANVYMWSHVYGTEIAEYRDYVVARNIGRTHHHFLYPVGGKDLEAVLSACVEDALAAGKEPMFYSIPESEVAVVEALFPGKFTFSEDRDEEDYLYLSTDLQELPGKIFQKKRNHISRFGKDHPDYVFEPIAPENLAEVRAFNNRWCQTYGCDADEGLAREHRAIEMVFDHYFELGLVGGLVRTGGQLVAFCYGSKISAEVLGTHVEKAWHDVNGAYPIINREYARAFGGAYRYINREEDLGEEGLRKAKLSYNPAILEKKFCAVLRSGG
ncbi:DUF2156 domain-containing protein [Anaerofilum sp. BX8]|uniref:DUF2156 domain-containing protein n=1 Tax=Anaerofilum hominis TaxID=2763016 RepID=A0A923I7H1_9FIRM|nr:phosphatidylglycerol lysyltransferase domain-containing protein [Anaerofilum hominis]MBC5580196.1 DUF2156 domain-containing protein [Anaerofilum hominis]